MYKETITWILFVVTTTGMEHATTQFKTLLKPLPKSLKPCQLFRTTARLQSGADESRSVSYGILNHHHQQSSQINISKQLCLIRCRRLRIRTRFFGRLKFKDSILSFIKIENCWKLKRLKFLLVLLIVSVIIFSDVSFHFPV